MELKITIFGAYEPSHTNFKIMINSEQHMQQLKNKKSVYETF